MKQTISFLILILLSLITFSCVKNLGNSNLEKVEGKLYKAKFLLSYYSHQTKASEEQVNSLENRIIKKDTYFFIFNKQGEQIYVVFGNEITWGQMTIVNGNYVNQLGTISFYNNESPSYMVCVANANNQIFNSLVGLSLNKFKEAIKLDNSSNTNNLETFSNLNNRFKEKFDALIGNTDSLYIENSTKQTTPFLMTNSSYINENGDVIQEINIEEHFKNINSSPISICIERVAAKVSISATNTWIFKNNGEDYQVEILGWKLNSTNKYFTPLKNINSNLNSTLQGWNSPVNKKSLWAIDNNYTNGNYFSNTLLPDSAIFEYSSTNTPILLEHTYLENIQNTDLNYITGFIDYNNLNLNNTEQPEYCFENTIDIANSANLYNSTHIIIVARCQRLTKLKSAFVRELFRYNNIIFNDSELYDFINFKLSNLDKKLNNGDGIININDISFDEKLLITNNQLVVKYSGDKTFGEYNNNNLTELIFGNTPIEVYRDGYCYYSIPIKHSIKTKEGKDTYGVVRNHWYKINITDVSGIGSPITPYKPLILNSFNLTSETNVINSN